MGGSRAHIDRYIDLGCCVLSYGPDTTTTVLYFEWGARPDRKGEMEHCGAGDTYTIHSWHQRDLRGRTPASRS